MFHDGTCVPKNKNDRWWRLRKFTKNFPSHIIFVSRKSLVVCFGMTYGFFFSGGGFIERTSLQYFVGRGENGWWWWWGCHFMHQIFYVYPGSTRETKTKKNYHLSTSSNGRLPEILVNLKYFSSKNIPEKEMIIRCSADSKQSEIHLSKSSILCWWHFNNKKIITEIGKSGEKEFFHLSSFLFFRNK